MSLVQPVGERRPTSDGPFQASESQIIELDIPARIRDALSAQALTLARDLDGDIEQDPTGLSGRGRELVRAHLPVEALAALEDLGRPSRITAVVLRGLAGLPTPPTPVSGYMDDRGLAAQDLILTGALRLAGSAPVAFPFENHGRIVRNVVPNPDQRGISSSHGFDVDLFFHQDNCGQPFEEEQSLHSDLPPMPKHLAFLVMRNEERVPMKVVLLDDVLAALPEGPKTALALNAFHIGAPESVTADGFGGEAIEGAAVLTFRGGFWESRYDPFLVTPRTPSAAAANARLILVLAEQAHRATDILLGAGDLMIFKNTRLFHMRPAFMPGPRDESRWLRRIYGQGLATSQVRGAGGLRLRR